MNHNISTYSECILVVTITVKHMQTPIWSENILCQTIIQATCMKLMLQ